MAITKEEVAEAVRAWCQAWHTRDIETLLVMEAPSFGFGFQPLKPRDHAARGEGAHRQGLQQFFGQKEAYSFVPENFETAVVGEIGLAWGTVLEQWQDKGQPPEQARVRFSKVLTKGAHGWQVLLYHRDIQPFAADGSYPKALRRLTRSRNRAPMWGLDCGALRAWRMSGVVTRSEPCRGGQTVSQFGGLHFISAR